MKKIVFCLIFVFSVAFGCQSLFAMEYMSSEEAAYFLGFLYNDSSLDAENLADNEFFKLITGEYADDSDTETDIKAAFIAFEEAQVNNNITDSAYKSNNINDILLKLAYKELDGMSEIDSEIVSEVNDHYLDKLKEYIIDGLCAGVYSSTGIIVTEEVLENLNLAYSGYTSLTGLGDKIEKFVDYTEAAVALAFSPLQSELNGRYSYFNLYIINRASYSGEVLETIMAYNLMALKENNWSTMLINCIPGKTSWVNCTDQIEEWAEYVYQLEVQLKSAANEITVPTTEAGETDDEVTEEATETTTAASGEKISGVYGDGVYWVYDTGTKIVFITGTGELTSYTPWSSYSVSGLWIGGDITYNGDYTVTSSLPLTVYGNFTVTGSVTVNSGNVTLYGNMTVGGNYTHNSNSSSKSTVIKEGSALNVSGNFLHYSYSASYTSNVYVNGSLYIGGYYATTFTYSTINLYMQKDSSYMAVKGNFTFSPSGKSGNFTAGKLAVGGTYTNNSGLNGTVLVTASDDDFDDVFIETTTAEAASETTTEGASETTTAAGSGSSGSSSDGSSENTYDPYSVSLDYPSKFLSFGNKTYLPGTPSKKKKEYVEEFYEWVKEFGYDDIISEEDVIGIILDYIPSLAYYEDSIAFTSDEYTTFDVMRDIIMLNSTLKSLNQWEQEYLIDPDAVNLTETAERVKNIISEYTDYEESVDRNPLVTAIYAVYSQQLINTVATAELKIVKSMFTDNVTNVINEGGAEELYDLMMEFNAAWKDCGIVSLSGIPEEVLDKLKSKSFKNVSKALVKSVISDIADEHSDVKLVYDIYNTSKTYVSGFKATSLMAQYAPGVLFQIQLLKLGKEIYDAIEETKSAQYFMINYYFKHALPDLYDEIIDDEGNILNDVITYNMLSGRTAFANELMNKWYSTNQGILDDETRTSLMTMANTAAQIQLVDVNSMRREVVEYWANKLAEEEYNTGLCQVQYTFSADDTFEIVDVYGNVIGMYSPDTGFVAYGTSTVSLLDEDEDSSAEETSYIVTVDEENGSVCVVVKDTTLSVVAYEQTSPSTVTAVTKGGSTYSKIYDVGGSDSVTYSVDEDGNITASGSSGETVDSTGTYSQAQSITDSDAENLKILYSAGDSADSVSANIELLTEGAYGSTITWASNNESIISTSGEVTRTAENQTVTLTATISYGDISTTKEFVLTVLSNIVTVSFDSCGGSEVSPQSLTAGDIADVSEIPTKDGYSFEGWYIDSYYNYPYEGEEIFGNITLYAKWISNGADWAVSDITLFIYSMGTENDYESGEAEWYDSRDLFDTVCISAGISGIGENAFYGCESLKTVVIPNSVTSIAETAFEGCIGITDVYCFADSAAAEFFADSEAEIHYIGDVSSDGNVDKVDAALMLKYVSGLASYDDISGYITDYNYDGVFNILDASAVMNSLKE